MEAQDRAGGGQNVTAGLAHPPDATGAAGLRSLIPGTPKAPSPWGRHSATRGVACHGHGTGLSRVLPRSWDHRNRQSWDHSRRFCRGGRGRLSAIASGLSIWVASLIVV